METFDIIKLIEKNPITRLTKNYENKLIEKIKNQFTESQQQLFVGSFYCYLNYNSKNDFVIDLDNVWKWVGFIRKDPAKRLLIKFCIENIDYRVLHPKVENPLGGRLNEQILMTINTFKKFCLKAGTKKADEIHDYYINLEELIQETINEESQELKNQLEEKDINHKIDMKMNKHNTLIDKLKMKTCVYIAEIKGNKIKIGSSKGIEKRKTQLVRLFGNCIFLDAFECDNYREVEINILADITIKYNMYKKPINGHESEEVVKLSRKFNYDQLITIVKKYVNQITLLTPLQFLEKQKLDVESQKLKLEKQKLDCNILLNIINNDKYVDTVKDFLCKNFPLIIQNVQVQENKQKDDRKDDRKLEINEIIENIKIKERKPKGRKIQKIDPDNLKKIIKVYDSMAYVLRSSENKGFTKSSIQTAIKNNRIYKGFRWNFVNLDDNFSECDILPTNKYKYNPPIRDSILQLNSTKTEILDSFYTKDYIAKKLNVSKKRMKDIIIKNEIYNDNYYIEYNKCPQELLSKYKIPINRIISNNSKQIKQINIISNESIIFNSLHEIYIKLGIADKTITEAIKNKVSCNGFLWQYYKDK
jgi:hypothetical protein